jgi:formylglycine-generating enzyme required for sulfatase activity
VEPEEWRNPSLGIAQPRRPVVGVTWFEANAYCRWVLRHWEQLEEGSANPGLKPALVRLPLEAEWVCAAGGEQPDGRYPWDPPGLATTDLDEVRRRANVDELSGATSAVDAHPQGASPWGVMDLAGNAWEWQANDYETAYKSAALRGGCWYVKPELACVASRSLDHIFQGGEGIGFRLLALETG